MTSRRLLPVGTKGCDFSYSKPPPAALIRNGFEFVILYECIPPSSPAKYTLETPYLEAGLTVFKIWEMSTSRASSGTKYSKIDADAFEAKLIACNYPRDVPAFIAVDTDVSAINIQPTNAYLRDMQQIMQRDLGPYGDLDIIWRTSDIFQACIVPNAYSWSGATSVKDLVAKATAANVNILQQHGYWLEGNWALDPDLVLHPLYGWNLKGEEEVTAHQTLFLIVDGLPGQYLWTPGTLPIPFTNIADRDAILNGLGIDPNVDGVAISKDMYDRLDDMVASPVVSVPPINVKYPTKINFTGTLGD